MTTCPKCGLPVDDNAKFCAVCGEKIQRIVHNEVCKVCGSQLKEGAKFCNVCGSPVGGSEQEKQQKAAQAEEERNPTMDEIKVPVIDDNIPELSGKKPLKDENAPTMDSVEIPGQKPKAPVNTQPAAEIPVPEPSAAQPVMSGVNSQAYSQNTQSTPNYNQPVNNTAAQPYQQPAQPVINPQPQAVVPPQQNMAANNVNPAQPVQSAQPNMNNINQMKNVVPGKSGKMLIPIILIILILAVIIFDVFFLFKDQIFGKDDDSKAKDNTEVIQSAEDYIFTNEIEFPE